MVHTAFHHFTISLFHHPPFHHYAIALFYWFLVQSLIFTPKSLLFTPKYLLFTPISRADWDYTRVTAHGARGVGFPLCGYEMSAASYVVLPGRAV